MLSCVLAADILAWVLLLASWASFLSVRGAELGRAILVLIDSESRFACESAWLQSSASLCKISKNRCLPNYLKRIAAIPQVILDCLGLPKHGLTWLNETEMFQIVRVVQAGAGWLGWGQLRDWVVDTMDCTGRGSGCGAGKFELTARKHEHSRAWILSQ